MRYTFPGVPPGRDITDAEAHEAALLVRDWYEYGGEAQSLDTTRIVTVVRWAIHRTRETQRSSNANGSDEPSKGLAEGHQSERSETAVQRPVIEMSERERLDWLGANDDVDWQQPLRSSSASSACPVCGIAAPHHHTIEELNDLRRRAAFLESKLGLAETQRSSSGARSDEPEGVGIRGAGSAQPEPTDEQLATLHSLAARMYPSSFAEFKGKARAALAAVTPTDPLDAMVKDAEELGLYETERSVSSPEAAIQDRADALRYRWLRTEMAWARQGDGQVKWVVFLQMADPNVTLEKLRRFSVARELDAAIDAAMKEQPRG